MRISVLDPVMLLVVLIPSVIVLPVIAKSLTSLLPL
jgi:hypothetical protein